MNPQIDINSWVDSYSNDLYRFAVSRVNDPAAVEDLMQDTFMAALKSTGSFKGQSSEKTWLISILKHKIFDYYRKKHLLSEKQMEYRDETEDYFDEKGHWKTAVSDWGNNPEKFLEDKTFMEILKMCIEKLRDLQKQAFNFRELDGLSTEEICKILKITTTNLNVILYRARHSLRRCMTDSWFKEQGNDV
jgi:RNA polymerase sigma-70 factor (ECF subfamily)